MQVRAGHWPGEGEPQTQLEKGLWSKTLPCIRPQTTLVHEVPGLGSYSAVAPQSVWSTRRYCVSLGKIESYYVDDRSPGGMGHASPHCQSGLAKGQSEMSPLVITANASLLCLGHIGGAVRDQQPPGRHDNCQKHSVVFLTSPPFSPCRAPAHHPVVPPILRRQAGERRSDK